MPVTIKFLASVFIASSDNASCPIEQRPIRFINKRMTLNSERFAALLLLGPENIF